jgi:hypothetical protein
LFSPILLILCSPILRILCSRISRPSLHGHEKLSVFNNIVVQKNVFWEVCQNCKSACRADQASLKGVKTL